MKYYLCASICFLAIFLCSCKLLIPDVPAPSGDTLQANNKVFSEISVFTQNQDINDAYTCGDLQSLFTASSYCVPTKTVRGATIHCKLDAPLAYFEMACGNDALAPDLYFRFVWRDDVTAIELPTNMGSCTLNADGPVTYKNPRYPGDPGYAVCLFHNALGGLSSALRPDGNTEMPQPSGIYLDFSMILQNKISIHQITMAINAQRFSGPLHLVADSRRLDPPERQAIFEALPTIFAELYPNKDPNTASGQE